VRPESASFDTTKKEKRNEENKREICQRLLVAFCDQKQTINVTVELGCSAQKHTKGHTKIQLEIEILFGQGVSLYISSALFPPPFPLPLSQPLF